MKPRYLLQHELEHNMRYMCELHFAYQKQTTRYGQYIIISRMAISCRIIFHHWLVESCLAN